MSLRGSNMFTKCLLRRGGGTPNPNPTPAPIMAWDPQYTTNPPGRHVIFDYDMLRNGRAIKWSPDGKYFYICARRVTTPESSSGGVVQFEAAEPYRIDLLTHVKSVSLRPLGEEAGGFNNTQGGTAGAVHGMQFRPDGKRVLIMNRWEIWQFDLAVPWMIESMQQGIYRDTWQDMDMFADPDDPEGDIMTTPYAHDICVGRDGTRIYIDQRPNRRVNQYNLSTPWDITSMEHEHVFVIPTTVQQYHQRVRGTEFDPSGRRMFTLNTYASMPYVNVFNLATPWELSTAKFAYEKLIDRYASRVPIMSHDWHPGGQRFWVTNMAETGAGGILGTSVTAVFEVEIDVSPTSI